MIDYTKMESTPAEPEASSMIETFRAIGYSIETAIADLLDNSISAGAKNIWINFEWDGSKTWLSIKDDGCGMTDKELIQAMRPGSKNPNELRDFKDLGRFGLGLKTASFSQCRKFFVITKKEGCQFSYWCWDLDYVNKINKWNLVKYLPDQEKFEKQMNEIKSGTIVIWNDIDRLVKKFQKEDKKALNKFLITMDQVKNHVATIFHRFMEKGLKIYIQDRIIKEWNPFLSNESYTLAFPEETFYDGRVTIKGYVLPHQSNISIDTFRIAGGVRGWNEQQGFYVYRNDRLLLPGDWLGIFRKDEHYKLARIYIGLPNNLDEDWQIDIKKAVARPPFYVREQLKAYAQQVRLQALEVYKHRGKSIKKIPGQKFVPLWIDHKRGNKWFYKINRDHPLIKEIIEIATNNPGQGIETLIRYIEETIPSKSIYIKEAEEPELQGNPFENSDSEPLRRVISQLYHKLIFDGYNIEQAKSIIFNIEPFNHFPEFLDLLSE